MGLRRGRGEARGGPCGCLRTRDRTALRFENRSSTDSGSSGGRSSSSTGSSSSSRGDAKVVEIVRDIINARLHGFGDGRAPHF